MIGAEDTLDFEARKLRLRKSEPPPWALTHNPAGEEDIRGRVGEIARVPVLQDVNDIARWCARRMPVLVNEPNPQH